MKIAFFVQHMIIGGVEKNLLLAVTDSSGPDNCYVGGIESFDDLSETAKEKVLAYYEAQGTLYDEEAELERAYAAWQEIRDRKSVV